MNIHYIFHISSIFFLTIPLQCLILRCFLGVVPLTGLVPAVGLHLVIPFVRTLAFLGVGPVGCNRWFLVAGIDGHAFGGRC